MKIPLYIVLHLHDRVVTEFAWTVIDADNGEPALWQPQTQGREPEPVRFRSEALAQAAADQLTAKERESDGTARARGADA